MNATTKSRSFSARRNRLTDRTLLPKTPLRADLPGRRGTEPASVPPSVLGWMRADGGRTRVLVVAENRLLREALCRMFMKRGTIEIANSHSGEPFQGKNCLMAVLM